VAATLRPRLARAIDSEPPSAATRSLTPVRPKPADFRHLGRIAAAIVLDPHEQRILRAGAPLDPQHNLARRAVAQRVGQAFLRDAIGGGGDSPAHVGEIALQVELDQRLGRGPRAPAIDEADQACLQPELLGRRMTQPVQRIAQSRP
jgi:hypothetical protein